MVRISAIFIAACMLLIAGSVGFVVYLRFGLTGAESALAALGTLTALAVYNAIVARKRDRLEATNQLANLARGSGDLARQLAEFARRLNAVEVKVESVIDRALATAQPLAAEIEELSTLVKQLADSVAAHDAALRGERAIPLAAGDSAAAAAGAAYAAATEFVAAAPAAPSAPSTVQKSNNCWRARPEIGFGRVADITSPRFVIWSDNSNEVSSGPDLSIGTNWVQPPR